jgi:enamine deaminase RidA (YjgF/YER057c/UK114 family)
MSQVEEKLRHMGYELPAPVTPLANYIPAYRTGNLVFLSGSGPLRADGSILSGKVGDDLSVEHGYEASRLCALNLLAQLKKIIGDLDRVKHIVKLLGMVNATPEFTRHPDVINGCSDLLIELFGDRGRHARSAVGMASLPHNYAVEIEMIVEVKE